MNVNIGLMGPALSLVLTLAVSVSAHAAVSNAPMYANRNTIDTTVHSEKQAASVAVLKASGVLDTLK